jgi:hypothetical protein
MVQAYITIGEMRNAYKILVGNLKGKGYSKDLRVDGKTILEWILGKLGGRVWSRFIWLRAGTSGGIL